MLNATTIIAEAETRVGISDTDIGLHRNLNALVDAINQEARLPDWGEAITHRNLVDRTIDRLEGLKWLNEHPEISNEVISEPVFLTGLPRSGTTFFQYLFDRDERFRLIRGWEALSPSPPPGADPASVQRRMAEEDERRRRSRPQIEGFEALHLVDSNGPEECHVFMEHSYAAAGLHNLLNVPSYFSYLFNELDMEQAYLVHKRQLQLLQWQLPQPRWALKYPNHLLAMDSILKVYPDARFVMTHRDPVQTLASIAKLTLTLRSIRYDDPLDPNMIGRQMLAFVRSHIDRIMAFAAGPHRDRVTHVDYYRLLDNPSAEMASVHAGLGIDSPAAVRKAVATWHQQNPKGARGANAYALEQFGLDGNEVAAQFSDYMQQFDIPREQAGLGGRRS